MSLVLVLGLPGGLVVAKLLGTRRLEGVVVALEAADRLAVEVQHIADDGIQKGACVRDDDEALLPCLQG